VEVKEDFRVLHFWEGRIEVVEQLLPLEAKAPVFNRGFFDL
jgi:hypothetical protein